MAQIVVQMISKFVGSTVSMTAADASGDSFTNDGGTKVRVSNESGSPITVVIDSKNPCNYGHDHDIEIVVANGTVTEFGPLETARFGTTVDMTYSDATNISVAVVK